MAVFEQSTWYNRNDNNWQNVTIVGGPVDVGASFKSVFGSANTIDELGFYRLNPILSSTGMTFQIDFSLRGTAKEAIILAGIGITTPLDNQNAASIVLDTFLDQPGFTGNIRFNDYNQNEVSGGTAIATLDVNAKYTLKIIVNANGTASAYVDSPGLGLDNQSLGTTTVATDLNGANVYYQVNQTFMGGSGASYWENFYIHDEGTAFVVPQRQDVNLTSADFLLKENYMEMQRFKDATMKKEAAK